MLGAITPWDDAANHGIALRHPPCAGIPWSRNHRAKRTNLQPQYTPASPFRERGCVICSPSRR